MAPAQGQTLSQALVGAYNSNPDLLAQRARLRGVDETVAQQVANWRPQIRATGAVGRGQLNSSTRTIGQQDLTTRQFGLTVTQPLFRGGKTLAGTRGAEADVLAERAVLLDREQTTLLNTVTAFSDYVRDLATVELRRNNVNVLNQQLIATQARFRVGELTRTDVAQAESRLEGTRADLIAAQAQAANSRAAYIRVIGIAPGQLQPPPLMGSVPPTEDAAINAGQEKAPGAIAAWHRVRSAEYGVDNAFGDLLPTLNLVGSWTRTYDSQLQGDRIDSKSIQLQASVPIYQNGAEYSRVRAAKQAVGQRLAELDGARRLAAETAVRAFRQYEAARARVESITAQIRAAGVALEGVRQEAQVGSRTTLDVLNAEQELLNAQVQLVSAQRDVVVGHYTLLSAIGQLTARSLQLPVEYYDEERNYKNVRDVWIGTGIK
ncbi:MAG: TolC family outer membrane protein [Alphaproteobacteria bacterium]|nr:TolC family outer membrane protein [Alphaproteobacteria bacterium]